MSRSWARRISSRSASAAMSDVVMGVLPSALCQAGERVHRGRRRGIELAVRCVIVVVETGPAGFGLACIWTKTDSGASFFNTFKHARGDAGQKSSARSRAFLGQG